MSRLPILLGCSVILLLTSRATVNSQEKSPFARWEKAIAAFEEQDKNMPPAKDGILFVGSSSIRRWDLARSFPKLPVINRGFGGSEIVDSTHFAERIIIKHKPRVVALYAGDNDIGRGKSPEQVFADFQAFARTIHAKLPESRIVFIAIKPSLKRWKLVDNVKKANGMIAGYCKKDKRLVYADIFAPMLGKDGMPRKELFAKDGLHLSDEGYRLWAKVLSPLIK